MKATYENITNLEFQDLLDNEDIVLIDVRSHDMYKKGHIEEAINIPFEDLDTYKGDKEIVHYVICQKGIKSKEAAELLVAQGYRVVNVAEGMCMWQGQSIED
ncbi:MAG: rhodanese-like domain-containing protein [Gemella sp.]|nr:rhodanese-like domain-containing protein [Gemella sp.]